MRILRHLLAVLVFAALFAGAWQFTHRNGTEVSIDFFFWTTPPIAIWAALLFAWGIGAVCTLSLLVLPIARSSLAARRYRKALAGLESEIHQLRNLPLAGSVEDAPGDALAAPTERSA